MSSSTGTPRFGRPFTAARVSRLSAATVASAGTAELPDVAADLFVAACGRPQTTGQPVA